MMPPNNIRRRLSATAILALALLSGSCDRATRPALTGPNARLSVFATLTGTSVAMMVVEVKAPDIMSPLIYNLQLSGGFASGSITVPAGSAREVIIHAYDNGGIETHRGVRTIDVVEGPNPTLILTLTPLTGQVPINASLGSVFIFLNAPSGGHLFVGDTERVTATVTDADGVALQVPIRWALVAPGAVAVDSNGLVLATAPGSVGVIATYGGFGAVFWYDVVEGQSDLQWSLAHESVDPVTGTGSILGVTTFAPNDAWAVGEGGSVFHYDGVAWSFVDIGGLAVDQTYLYQTWGPSATDLWVVGSEGHILRYDGTTWSRMPNPVNDTQVQLMSIWGTSSSDVWVGGSNGTFMHWDGTTWNTINLGVMGVIGGIWGTGPSDVFAAGPTGKIWHWDGTTGTLVHDGGQNLRAIYGLASNDVFAVGWNGYILHFDGTSWIEQPQPNGSNLRSVWGAPGLGVYAVGFNGTRLFYNGSTWTDQSSPDIRGQLNAISGSGPTDVHVVGSRGTTVHFNGSWSLTHQSGAAIWSVWAASPTRAFAVGAEATVLMYDGRTWSPLGVPWGGTLSAVWGTSESDVWVTAVNGAVLHYDGQYWEVRFGGSAPLRAIHGTRDGIVYAVGDYGNIFRLDQWGGWTQVHSGGPTLDGVFAITANDVYAVGANGTILHFNGVDWTQQVSGTDAYLDDVWAADAQHVFAVGTGGTILARMGGGWNLQPSGTTQRLAGVWGTSASNVLASGAGGTILRFDGTGWIPQPSGTTADLPDIWGSSARNVWVAGFGGERVLHGAPAAAGPLFMRQPARSTGRAVANTPRRSEPL